MKRRRARAAENLRALREIPRRALSVRERNRFVRAYGLAQLREDLLALAARARARARRLRENLSQAPHWILAEARAIQIERAILARWPDYPLR